jgi:hypothetical protein
MQFNAFIAAILQLSKAQLSLCRSFCWRCNKAILFFANLRPATYCFSILNLNVVVDCEGVESKGDVGAFLFLQKCVYSQWISSDKFSIRLF